MRDVLTCGPSKDSPWCCPLISTNIFCCCCKGMETSDASGYRREWMEGQCEDSDPRKTTAEGSRHISDTSQQPSVYGGQTSILKERSEMMKEMDEKIRKEMFERMKEMDNKIRKEMFERMKEMDDKIRKEMFEMTKEMDDKIRKEMFEMMKEMDNEKITLTDPINTPLHLPESYSRAFPGRAIKIQQQKKDEYEVLKEKNKNLESRYQELLAKTMSMHQHSEDINDPLRLSAVLQRYEMLQLQQWEKVRSSMPCYWTYEQGRCIIKKLFDACEKDIQQRTDDILKALAIPLWNNAVIEETMRAIRKLFRQPYYQNYPKVHSKIVQEADILTGAENETESQFLLQCCQIYCLLLLQDPPVKAEWKMNRRYLEHVDKKDPVYWKNPSLLWPIMKRGEDVVAKGVVWDQRRTT
ncbi:probable DNA double-strand break repair Rad50 ATPase isoform X2 [Aphelocoma coerulescens]|uniref:probable DNA double-strand break repair Rad50 ATPase isoform X2 n=1 Tax=Aphelocoma coerulescens TaxID=39617 RepID=UPI003604E630